MVDTLRRLVDATADPRLVELEREIGDYPTVRALEAQRAISKAPPPQLLVPFDFLLGDQQLSMFTTLTTFGTARDITLEDVDADLKKFAEMRAYVTAGDAVTRRALTAAIDRLEHATGLLGLNLNEAAALGARVLHGNVRRGALYSPTVVDRVDPGMPLVRH